MVAADGASSTVRRGLDIAMEGDHDLATMINCHFVADLGPFTEHRPAMLYWTTDPARSVFQKIDVHDRWLCQIGYHRGQHDASDFDADLAASWIRRSVGFEDLPVEVLQGRRAVSGPRQPGR